MQISQRYYVPRSWFNICLKDHGMAVPTHFQQMPYDIFSLLYVLIFRCCILLFGTVYIGSELIEISEPINVMKIFLGSFCLYFLIGVSGGSDFFTDVKIGIRSTFQIPWTSSWSVQNNFQGPLKTTNKFQLKPRIFARIFNPIFNYISPLFFKWIFIVS